MSAKVATISERVPPGHQHDAELLSVSAAARLLGVSPSSLRAWAAQGWVPHHRTEGGHRRFELNALVEWLNERGGGPPAPRSAPTELVPTRMESLPEAAALVDENSDELLQAFEEELARNRPGAAARPSATRRSRVSETLRRALDRIVVRVASGYADGVQRRLQIQQEEVIR